MRSEPVHRSEMVSQVLYGEAFDTLETKGSWQKIRLNFDGYEGWVDGIPGELAEARQLSVVTLPSVLQDGTIMPMGAEFNGPQAIAPGIVQTAFTMINTPYLWGGRTFMGIDCSGFTQVVFKANGLALPRDASQQVNEGEEVEFEESMPEDLAFFISDGGKVTHVGIVLEHNKIIHASQFVRVDDLTREGIFREGEMTHKLFKIKRLK